VKHLEGGDTSSVFNQKKSKNVYFLLQNRHLKPKIDCKNNGKWKLQTCFSPNYDFAFKNLFKNVAEVRLVLFLEVIDHF
jgi:hypothetical protein